MWYRSIVSICMALAACLVPAAHAAPGYPDKPVRILVPWAAGGAADFLARAISERMTAQWSVPVIVENRPGAATNIGTQFVASAQPDGYTLLMASSNNCVNVSLYKDLGFDFARDFVPVTNVGLAPNVLVVPAALPAHSVRELIALAKADPGKLTYGSSGNGSAAHLAAERFQAATGTRLLGVPYKGAAPAVADLLGNRLSMMFTVLPPTLGHIRAGTLRLLAVASSRRLPLFPDTPTVGESGVPSFESSIWYGLVAPRGTPEAVVAKVQQTVAAILAEPDIVRRLAAQGTIAVGDSSQAFGQTIAADIESYGRLIRSAHIQPQ